MGHFDTLALHVVFHGCKQSASLVERKFVEHAGYNRWADTNAFIVLYPQTIASSSAPLNPVGTGGATPTPGTGTRSAAPSFRRSRAWSTAWLRPDSWRQQHCLNEWRDCPTPSGCARSAGSPRLGRTMTTDPRSDTLPDVSLTGPALREPPKGAAAPGSVINPYALAEVVCGRRIDWRQVEDAPKLWRDLGAPYQELFDPQFGGPLYLGLARQEGQEGGGLRPERSPLLDIEPQSGGNDLERAPIGELGGLTFAEGSGANAERSVGGRTGRELHRLALQPPAQADAETARRRALHAHGAHLYTRDRTHGELRPHGQARRGTGNT